MYNTNKYHTTTKTRPTRTTTTSSGAELPPLLKHFNFQKIEWLYLTYGLLFGAGASLAYNPSLTVLGLYFKVILINSSDKNNVQ